ncbi:MAG TPA: sensor domain-containing diguanylate cyclase [Acidobacteriota bacterium]|nr:sensor domain-containing diguanylate cyclase [Acidobacteriota bacterium]
MATAALNVECNRGLLDLFVHAFPQHERATELYRRLLAINELAASMNASMDADRLQSCLATYFQDWMPDISARLCILDGESYRRSRLSGPNIFSEEGNSRLGGSPTGGALRSAAPLWIRDLRSHGGTEDPTDGDHPHGCIMVLPLTAVGRVVGALEIVSDQPNRFDEIDYHLSVLVAAHASCSIENVLTKQELASANARLRDHDIRLTQLNLQLQQLAHTDDTTGLFNKRRLFEQLQAEIARARRYGEILSCLMLDIDEFKQVNDTYGHQAGDEVLRQIGGLLRRSLRVTDFVARYGGEEFTVLLPHTNGSGAARAAENLRNTMKKHEFVLPSARIHLTVSIGIACCTKFDKLDAQQIILRADNALYRAKRAGRDRVCCSEEREPETIAVKKLSNP